MRGGQLSVTPGRLAAFPPYARASLMVPTGPCRARGVARGALAAESRAACDTGHGLHGCGSGRRSVGVQARVSGMVRRHRSVLNPPHLLRHSCELTGERAARRAGRPDGAMRHRWVPGFLGTCRPAWARQVRAGSRAPSRSSLCPGRRTGRPPDGDRPVRTQRLSIEGLATPSDQRHAVRPLVRSSEPPQQTSRQGAPR